MKETCESLLATQFMPHGHCYFWKDEILWPIVIGDALTVLAYLLIPIILLRFIYQRKDMRFNFVFQFFALFILSCGFGHFVEILNIWEPHYVLSAVIKMVTGSVSIGTVGLLLYVYPQAMRIPTLKEVQEANQKLSQSKEVLQMFIKYTPHAIAMFDKNLNYLAASDKWYTDYRIDGQAIIGKHHYDVFPEIRKMPHWQDNHKRCLAGEVYKKERDQFVRADGRIDWLRYEIHPWRTDEGAVGGIIMFTENITDRVILEDQARESEKRFRAIFEGTPVGVALVKDDRKPEVFNQAFANLLGYKPEELKQLTFAEFTHPDYVEQDKIYHQELIDGVRDAYRLEKKYICKNYSEIWVDLSVSLIRDKNNKPEYAVVVVQDISVRKEIQERLNRTNRRLEDRVKERTQELTVLNQELESFSYSVSHDLRAPLRAINGFAEMLEEDYADKLDDEGKDNIKVIRDNALNMGQLIDDLLQFSRLGRQEIVSCKIDMNGLVSEIIEGIKIEGRYNHVIINYESLPQAKGDVALVRQVMVNLITNAAKYSSKVDNPLVTITSVKKEGKDVYVVKDNGVGFDMKFYDKLFGVFQRLHSQEDFEGTGVGLAIVERIIKRHGGRIWAESEKGKGAIFYFYLKPTTSNPTGGLIFGA